MSAPIFRTVEQARAWLNQHFAGKTWSKTRTYHAMATGELPSVEIDGRKYVPDLEGWLADKARAAKRPPAREVTPALDRPRRFGTPARDRRVS
jgi:hypothetical protein